MQIRKSTFKYGAAIALVGSIAIAVAGCSSSSPAATDGAKSAATIAFANYTDNSTLFGPVKQGVKDAAKSIGYQVSTYDNKGDAQTTLTNAQLIAQKKPSIVVEYSPDPSIGASLYSQFSSAGIPCIALNVPTQGCSLLNVVNANQGKAAGKLAADYASGKGWTGDNTTVLLLDSPAAGDEVNDTVRYFYTSFSSKAAGFTRIAPSDFTLSTTKIADNAIVVDGSGSIDTAFTATQSALQNIPAGRNIVVSGNSDDVVLGAWRAIDEAGRASTSVAVGFGGSEAALKQLKSNPQWIGELDPQISVWGYYAVAMSKAILDGAKAPKLTELPFVVETKANLSDYYGSDLSKPLALPAPLASNKYLFGQGVLENYGK